MLQRIRSSSQAAALADWRLPALALARKGFQVTVLERAARYQEIGAGIQLGPNAFHAFDQLKLGDAARATAVFIDQLRLMDAISGEEITQHRPDRAVSAGASAIPMRWSTAAIYTASSSRACEAEPAITLRTGCDVVGYDQDGTQSSRGLKSGERISRPPPDRAQTASDPRIRQQMVDDGPPRIAGHTTYRSGDPDRADAGGSELERRNAVGRRKVPSGALSALRLEGLQPRHHLRTTIPLEAFAARSGDPRGGAGRVPRRASARASRSFTTAGTGRPG